MSEDVGVIFVTHPFVAWRLYREVSQWWCRLCDAPPGEPCMSLFDKGSTKRLVPHRSRFVHIRNHTMPSFVHLPEFVR